MLRVDYNNSWPNVFNFPVEDIFFKKIQEKNIKSVFEPVKLKYSETIDFQFYLGFLLDALDMLPMRPDIAFDSIWRALDAEAFKVQEEEQNKQVSRFDLLIEKIEKLDNAAIAGFYKYFEIIPYQTCEYAAKRIIESSVKALTDKHASDFLKRAKASLGEDFVEAFLRKYPVDSNDKPSPANQRNAGRLLKKIFGGEEIVLESKKYVIKQDKLAIFLLKVVFANSRNERFHAKVFPPFRSSVAKLETYAHAYFLFHISYYVLLDIFLYRAYGVINNEIEVTDNIDTNIEIFEKIFSQ